jgi:hypothetical protein
MVELGLKVMAVVFASGSAVVVMGVSSRSQHVRRIHPGRLYHNAQF